MRPADIDIVVAGATLSELQEALDDMVIGRTKFGGLVLKAERCYLDVWPITETWAFKMGHIKGSSPEQLPLTTFLNIDAIAVELIAHRGKPRTIYEHGFFVGVEKRTVEVNLEANAFLDAALRRAVAMAARLSFQLGPRLVGIIAANIEDVDWGSGIGDRYRGPHGAAMSALLKEIRLRARRGVSDPLPVPPMRWVQSSLWEHDEATP